MDFLNFKHAVGRQFNQMKDQELFRTQVDKDALWETYLSSFPEGSNPIFRERTTHDCNCCKQFIRVMGNVVAIVEGKLISIWDFKIPEEPEYQIVADTMSALVKSMPVENIFLHYEKHAGTDKSFEQIDNDMKTWDHFFVNIPNGVGGLKSFYCSGSEIGTVLGEARATHDVLLRSLKEITLDSVDTVLELIAQDGLYRGEEHKTSLLKFKKLKEGFNKIPTDLYDNYVWLNSRFLNPSISKIRSTVIGTLLISISEGDDLDKAVRSYESKVSGDKYKRPNAVYTEKMKQAAAKTVEELGLTSALQRRRAVMSDITINNVIFADRSIQPKMAESPFNLIDNSTAPKKFTKKNLDKVQEINIEKFIKDVIPTASSIEIMVENNHVQNLVNLISPVDPTAGHLFKWDNNFSWAYNGNTADSIKERVKNAGGNVTGDLCCRLAWSNMDDLDFHMTEPAKASRRGYKIYYGNREKTSPNGGKLDVDANAGGRLTRTPVENIFYKNKSRMSEGDYILEVNNFRKRETINFGFEVEIEMMGVTYNFNYDKPLDRDQTIQIAVINYSEKDGFKIVESLPSTQRSKSVWNINTGSFSKVNAIMMSPNYWDGAGVGNKHYFFMIDDCSNEDTARGFFNEFLRTDLNEHRKVFEALGSKLLAPSLPDELSGVGFSSTQRNSILCRVGGSLTSVMKVKF